MQLKHQRSVYPDRDSQGKNRLDCKTEMEGS